MTRPNVPATQPGTTPPVLSSDASGGGRGGFRPSDILTTPAPAHGWLRRTCINTWFLMPVLFLAAVVPAFIIREAWSWTVLAVIAAAWVFAQAVANPDLARETDRRAYTMGALTTVALGVFVTLIIVGIRVMGGWLG